jgi:hypothetical protein
MKELTSTSFGYLIAFLLPGLLGLYAASYWIPEIDVLLQPIQNANANVGPSIMLLLIAVGIGVCVSSVRHFVLVEFFYKKIFKKRGIPSDIYTGVSPDELVWHKTLAEEHYRYHQFYGGCAVSILVMFVGWLAHGHLELSLRLGYVTACFVLAEVLLERSAADCHMRYVDKSISLACEKGPKGGGKGPLK